MGTTEVVETLAEVISVTLSIAAWILSVSSPVSVLLSEPGLGTRRMTMGTCDFGSGKSVFPSFQPTMLKSMMRSP